MTSYLLPWVPKQAYLQKKEFACREANSLWPTFRRKKMHCPCSSESVPIYFERLSQEPPWQGVQIKQLHLSFHKDDIYYCPKFDLG